MIILYNQFAEYLVDKILQSQDFETQVGTTSYYTSAEMRVSFPKDQILRDGRCILFMGCDKNSNETLVETLLYIYELRSIGVKERHLVMPYMPYGRQYSHEEGIGSAIPFVVDTLNAQKLSSITILDTHTRQIVELIHGCWEIRHFDIFSPRLPRTALIVSPDRGGRERLKVYEQMGYSVASLEKRRITGTSVEMVGNVKEFYGKDCIIIDDIVDSACTVCTAADFIKKAGAKTVNAFVTHNVMGEGAVSLVEASALDSLVVADMSPATQHYRCRKIVALDITDVIANRLRMLI